MKKRSKKFYVFITSVIISLLHLPFAFAKSATGNKLFYFPASPIKSIPTNSINLVPSVKSIYDSLQLNISGLSRQAFEYAKKGIERLMAQGKLLNDSIVAIVDFSQSSDKKRLYVLDLRNYKVLFNTFVAHGRNSGREWANSFSNQESSLKSSPGFYKTGETYIGHNGYSLRLEGLERGINDKAFERTIVMHGADYVSQDHVNAQGFIGRSWGCPAVPAKEAIPIINSIKNGACLFIYSPDQQYLAGSPVLN